MYTHNSEYKWNSIKIKLYPETHPKLDTMQLITFVEQRDALWMKQCRYEPGKDLIERKERLLPFEEIESHAPFNRKG